MFKWHEKSVEKYISFYTGQYSANLKAYMEKTRDAGDISPPIFWIFRQILGWERNFRPYKAFLGQIFAILGDLRRFKAIFRPNFPPIFFCQNSYHRHKSPFSHVWCSILYPIRRSIHPMNGPSIPKSTNVLHPSYPVSSQCSTLLVIDAPWIIWVFEPYDFFC